MLLLNEYMLCLFRMYYYVNLECILAEKLQHQGDLQNVQVPDTTFPLRHGTSL